MKDEIKKVVTGIIVVLIIGVIIWFTRPLWHWFFMGIYTFPAILESAIAAGIGTSIPIVWDRLKKRRSYYDATKIIGFFLIAFIVLLIILLPFSAMYPQCYLAKNLKTTKITELPEMDTSAIRILPFSVAKRYGEDNLQYPRFKLGTGNIVFINNTPYWSFGLIPDGAINFFVLKDKGALYVDMTSLKKNITIIEQEMEVGEGMGIIDSYEWQIYQQRYWVNLENPYFVYLKGDLYIAVPMISYEYHWKIPTFFAVPKWEGTALIDSKGKITFLTPEEARKVLKEQKLFPEKLARYYVDSFQYAHGILNKWFYHYDQLEIADVPGQQNEQPFLVKTKEGLKWLVACEPYGEAHGIFRIYLIDAQTGEIQVYEQPKTEALIGPVRAVDYVQKANPIVDWTRMMPVEPIPMIVKGQLFWQVRVVPRDGAGIAYIAMVNARTGEVVELKTEKEVKEFLEGKYKPEEKIPEISKHTTALIIIRENGKEIQRIELLPNQSIEIIPVA